MKIWTLGKWEEINIGQKVVIARCGSGKSYFGEFATLTRTTKNHLVFTTESGSIVKTKIDSLQTVGKFSNYFVSLNVKGREDMISKRVSYWNAKKLCLEYK